MAKSLSVWSWQNATSVPASSVEYAPVGLSAVNFMLSFISFDF